MSVIVLMSAIVPTQGHLDLLKFAHKFAHDTGSLLTATPVRVLIGTRKGEPTTFEQRRDALSIDVGPIFDTRFTEIDETGVEDLIGHYNQYIKDDDYVVSSEEYARELNGISIPYDIDRLNDPTRGTDVRRDLLKHFSSVIPSFRKHVGLRVTMFGAESVGKTTVTKYLASLSDFTGRAEFARPYLEHKDTPGYDMKDMWHIWRGQYALQRMTIKTPFLVQDTDLYSTLGYYRIMGEVEPAWTYKEAEEYKSDLYVILDPAGAPFTPDPLRYGGDHRESQLDFWVSLAEEFDLNYVVKTANDAMNHNYLYDAWFEKTEAIRNYRRP